MPLPDMLNNFVASQMLAFLLGVLACWAFWYVLLWLTPRLKIAPEAAYDPVQGRINVKVANIGTRQITDIEAELVLFDRIPEGRLVPVRRGVLDPPNILALEVRKMVGVPWCLPTVYVFVCKNGTDLYDALQATPQVGERRVVFTISARDAVSGTKKVQRVTFARNAVKVGTYTRGLAFDVQPQNA